MNEKWFYAYLRLKHAKENTGVNHDISIYEKDRELFESLVAVISPPTDWKPSGDGKFSRLKNYIKLVIDHGKFVKQNWCDSDQELTDALAALLIAFEFVNQMMRQIEKAP